MSDASSSEGRSSRDMILIAHAVVGSLAFLLVSPLAIIIARFFRNSSWFKWHAALHFLTLALVVTGFGLGAYATGYPHFTDLHTSLGLAVMLIALAQVTFGMIAHYKKTIPPTTATRFPTLAGKPLIRLGHIFTGVGLVIIAWIQVKEGIDEWSGNSDAQSDVPRGVYVVFWLLVGFWTLLYVGGWVREGLQGKRVVKMKNLDSEETTFDEEQRMALSEHVEKR